MNKAGNSGRPAQPDPQMVAKQGPDVTTISWQTGRTITALPLVRSPDGVNNAEDWPTGACPAKPLRPWSGQHTGPHKGRLQVVAIAIFGVDQARQQMALKQIERQKRTKGDFLPLILTDSPLHAPLRRAGALVEYFPTDVYLSNGAEDLLNQRFAALWKKWQPTYIIDLGRPGLLRAKLENHSDYFRGPATGDAEFDPRIPLIPPAPPAVTDVASLKAAYRASLLDQETDTFVLYRILGNDLPPRHEDGQTLANLKFILDNEPSLPRCEKRWIVNRIADKQRERAIIDLLERHDQPYLRIPFDMDEYRAVDWDLDGFGERAFFLNGRYEQMSKYAQMRAQVHARRHKNRYVMNNNGARNAALADGRGRAKWILPWDGNCFLTTAAWKRIREGVHDTPYMKYFLVPMMRVQDNSELVGKSFRPEPLDEPQVIFRTDAEETFNDAFHYSRRPKVEFFWRLGVQGPWDTWRDDLWDLPRPERSSDAGSVGRCGWVARLASGREASDQSTQAAIVDRGITRLEGIVSLIDGLDHQALAAQLDPSGLTAYSDDLLSVLKAAPGDTTKGMLFKRLVLEAELALQRGPYCVLDKTRTPPSGDKHDYYNPRPYWWPDPNTPQGLPGRYRDGERAPGTRLYEAESESYDRTRLQRMFDDTTILALAAQSSGNRRYSAHAAQLVRKWFLDPASRMSPHLEYAQVMPGMEGTGQGIIELKDMYFFLDAVRLLERLGDFTPQDSAALKHWLNEYLKWLLESPQGERECRAQNNHGAAYDLQVGAIAAYLGDVDVLAACLRRARDRITGQFENSGAQLHELKRTQTRHYCFFNLQIWANLATLADACGDTLWAFSDGSNRGLAGAFKWLFEQNSAPTWPHAQTALFDADRVLPLVYTAQARFAPDTDVGRALSLRRKPLFFPHDGIPPFWMLSRAVNTKGHGTLQALIRPIALAEKCAPVAVEGQQDRPKAQVLEKRLWGGYAKYAVSDLEHVKNDPSKSDQDREHAAWALARWSGFCKDDETALHNLHEAETLSGRRDRKYLLAETDCLIALGRPEEARNLISDAIRQAADDPNLFFQMGNTFASDGPTPNPDAERNRLAWINKVFLSNGLAAIEHRDHDRPADFFNLKGADTAPLDEEKMSDRKVSVVMPVYNGADTIGNAVRSVQEQTWTNLEIIVVDDCSTDETRQIVETIARDDPRVIFLPMARNGGAYVARNMGMSSATGRYVTVHDADDWSHPQKIETQMKRLRQAPQAKGVLSRWVRMRPDLYAEGYWRPTDTVISVNQSSFLFPRELLRETGPWDNVRIGADNEFIWRFKILYGEDAIVETNRMLPLSLSLVRDDSLTRQSATHVRTVFHGLRKDYHRSYRRWQSKCRDDVSLHPGDGSGRTFPAPRAVLPDRAPVTLDTVFLADFSTKGFMIDETAQLIAQNAGSSRKIGIFHWPDYENDRDFFFHPMICELLDSFKIEQVSAFQDAGASRVVLCDPMLAHYQIEGLPDFRPRHVDVLCRYAASLPVLNDTRRRRLPHPEELKQIFQMPCNWIDVAPG